MKKIAIIKDGYSDFMVLKSFISSIFTIEQNIELEEKNFIDLQDLNIGGEIGKYLGKANTSKETNINGKHATVLKRAIINVLYVALKDKEFNNKDIIILNGDAEHKLIKNEYFFEDWVRRLYSIINLSIEEFYQKMNKQGLTYQNLPIIIPLILFPSIEILVAACYLSNKDKKTIRNLRAKPDLKKKVWETDNIPAAIKTGKIKQVIELCFNNHNNSFLHEVYREIPEARNIVHTLTYPEKMNI